MRRIIRPIGRYVNQTVVSTMDGVNTLTFFGDTIHCRSGDRVCRAALAMDRRGGRRESVPRAMESVLLGLVLDSSVLVAAERKNLTTPLVIARIQGVIDDVPIETCSLTVAQLGYGIYRAKG